MPRHDPAEYYHDGGTMRRINPEVPTGICGVCGERYKTRADGIVRMHTRAPREGELKATYWCEGGMPAGAR